MHRPPVPLAPVPRVLTIALAALAPALAAAATPDRVWGTYLGGAKVDAVEAVAVDGAGNVYVAGYSTSPTGIATAGSHQAAIGGENDAFLVKFTPAGARVWGTYFGGAKTDYAFHMSVDADGRALVVGETASQGGIATAGALVDTFGPGGFAARFDADGQRLWATYLPNGTAYASAIAPDGTQVIAGTISQAFPFALPNALQPQHNGGIDRYVLALSEDGALVWGTYLDADVNAGVDVAADAHGVLVAYSSALPGLATPGVHQEAPADGSVDGVVVRFDAAGARVWATYYGGPGSDTDQYDVDVEAAPDGGAWFATQTASDAGIASPGAFQTARAGKKDIAVARLGPAGQRVWGTFLGSAQDDQPIGLTVDAAGYGTVAGSTFGGAGLATADAFQTAPAGSSDLFFTRFGPEGGRRFASYFGGPAQEQGFSDVIAASGLGAVYLAGYTQSTAGISTPDAHQPSHGGGSYDALLVRFAGGLGLPCADDSTCESSLCVDGVCCAQPCGGDEQGDCRACSAAAGSPLDGLCGALAADVVCRPAADACDAPETCPGDAFACPADADAADATPCDGGACMAGLCVPDEPASTGDPTTGDPTTGDPTTGDAPATTTGATTTEAATTTSDPPTTGEPAATTSTSGPSPTTGEPATTSTGDATTGPSAQDEPGGCGCRQSPVLQDSPLLALLAVPRRRRASPDAGAPGSAGGQAGRGGRYRDGA